MTLTLPDAVKLFEQALDNLAQVVGANLSRQGLTASHDRIKMVLLLDELKTAIDNADLATP